MTCWAAVLEAARETVEASPLRPILQTVHRQRILENIRLQKTDLESWFAKVHAARRLLREIRDATESENERLIATAAPVHLRKVLATDRTRNVLAIRRLCELAGHPDVGLPDAILNGFPSTGPAPVTGLWRPVEAKEPSGEQAKAFFDQLVTERRRRPGFPDDLLTGLIHEIEEDVKRGRFAEITFEELQAPPSLAFPKDESDETRQKIRLLIDERERNAFSTPAEKLQLYGSAHIAELLMMYTVPAGEEESVAHRVGLNQARRPLWPETARRLAEAKERLRVWGAAARQESDWSGLRRCLREAVRVKNADPGGGPGGVLPEMASDDISKAYYLFGTDAPETSPFCAYDPLKAGWRYFLSYVLNMGAFHSVPSFCRVSEALMGFAAFLGLALLAYLDDANYVAATVESIVASKALYWELIQTIGLELSTKPAADQSSHRGSSMRVLGLQYRWLREAQLIEISPTDDKLQRLVGLCDELLGQLASKSLDLKTLLRAAGLGTFVIHSTPRKIGAECLRVFYDFGTKESFAARVKDRDQRARLRRAILLLRERVRLHTPLVVAKQRRMPIVHLWTDASSDGVTGPEGETYPCLGGVLLDEDGEIFVYSLPAVHHRVRRAGIEVLEALAAYVAYTTWADQLKGRFVYCDVDNIGEMYALVKLSAKNSATCNVAAYVAKLTRLLDMATHYGYVKSELNPADAFTRWDLTQEALRVLDPWVTIPRVPVWGDLLSLAGEYSLAPPGFAG